jgi:hypothetical protein
MGCSKCFFVTLLIISILTLTGLIVLRKPQFGREKVKPTNLAISPSLLRLQMLSTKYTSTFNVPISAWFFNHALIDISIDNIEITAHLIDDNNRRVPNIEVTGEIGPLNFKASTNTSFKRIFRGSLNFTVVSIKKDFISGIFNQCSNDSQLMKAGYKARISIFPLSLFGIFPVKHGVTMTHCPEFATSGFFAGKGGIGNGSENNPQFPRLATLSGAFRNFLSRNQNGVLNANANANQSKPPLQNANGNIAESDRINKSSKAFPRLGSLSNIVRNVRLPRNNSNNAIFAETRSCEDSNCTNNIA